MDNAGLILIEGQDAKGRPIAACFAPSRGMNLLSFKQSGLEAIDQSTKNLFDERSAGLGAMIGPHFHHRKVIPHVEHEELFPHIALLKSKGVKEPFSHGIGRYAPWQVEASTKSSIKAVLRGSQTWNQNALKALEGQDFEMRYEAEILPDGLLIKLSVTSETDSVVGLHTYYALAEGQAVIRSRVQDHYLDNSESKPIPSTWNYLSDHTLQYPLDRAIDFGFQPYPDPLKGKIALECKDRLVQVSYHCDTQENSFQIWHPQGVSFACIEPLSAKDPRKPKLSVSKLQILISLLEPSVI